MRTGIKRPRLSPAKRLRQRRELENRFHQQHADYALENAARLNSVEITHAKIVGACGTISACVGPCYKPHFRLELTTPEGQPKVLDAGLLDGLRQHVRPSLEWPATDEHVTRAALAIICPAKYEWPPKPEIPW